MEGKAMHIWGHGNFQNDDASQWVDQLVASSDLSFVRGTLETLIPERKDSLEAGVSCRALAAAEVVAALAGRPGSDVPEAVGQWIANKTQPDETLLAMAREAVTSVMFALDSELRDQWAISGNYGRWQAAQGDLKLRLG